jgi:hypothetical protein
MCSGVSYLTSLQQVFVHMDEHALLPSQLAKGVEPLFCWAHAFVIHGHIGEAVSSSPISYRASATLNL